MCQTTRNPHIQHSGHVELSQANFQLFIDRWLEENIVELGHWTAFQDEYLGGLIQYWNWHHMAQPLL